MAQPISNTLSTGNAFLQSYLAPKPAPAASAISSVAPNMSTNSGPAYASPSGTITPVKASNGFDMSSLTPQQQALYNSALSLAPKSSAPAQQPTYSGVAGSGSGSLIPQAPAQAAPQATPQAAPQAAPQAQPSAPQTPGPAAGMINPALNETIQSLIKQAQGGSPQQAQAQKDLTDAIQREQQLQENYAQQNYNIKNAGTDLSLQTGQQQNLSEQYAGREAAAQSAIARQQAALGQAQTQQTQQLGALGTAAGLQTPSNQYQQIAPGNYALDASGNPVGGGQATGIKAATNWAIAQQNMEQGRDYQGQSQAISNALQTLEPVRQSIVPYMSANKLDANGVPFVNKQINTINKQANPADYATMEAAISEARSYAIQLLGSQSGANPTDVTNSVNQFDFENFTPLQLNTFLNNLNILGQYRLSQAQSASQAGYGANNTVGTPAQGMNANTGGALQSGGANLLNNLPDPVKAFAGGTINFGSDILNSLGNTAGQVSAGAAGGAAESGLAKTVLGL